MLLVRLLVLSAVAALALLLLVLDMMQPYCDGYAFGKRAMAQVFSLDLSQGLFRLGSGAFIYPRTLRSLRANTLAPTAPPYAYGSDTFLGYASLNTREVPTSAMTSPYSHGPHSDSSRLGNGGTPDFQSAVAPGGNSLPTSIAGTARPPRFLAVTRSTEKTGRSSSPMTFAVTPGHDQYGKHMERSKDAVPPCN